MRLLVVDDDPEIMEVARLALERIGGHEVACAATAAEAVETASREVPDALVLDVLLPDAEGPDLLATLRGLPGMAAVPAVFLTGKSDAAWAARLTATGAAGVVTKPFDPMALSGEIERLLSSTAGS